jgi:hypothetical protein
MQTDASILSFRATMEESGSRGHEFMMTKALSVRSRGRRFAAMERQMESLLLMLYRSLRIPRGTFGSAASTF